MSKFMDDFRRGYASGYRRAYVRTRTSSERAREAHFNLWVRFWRWVLGKGR